jgi:hypothetical protein
LEGGGGSGRARCFRRGLLAAERGTRKKSLSLFLQLLLVLCCACVWRARGRLCGRVDIAVLRWLHGCV